MGMADLILAGEGDLYDINEYHMLAHLKGTATLMSSMFFKKELRKPRILKPVSSKSVEKCESCVRLNICKWTVMEAAIL